MKVTHHAHPKRGPGWKREDMKMTALKMRWQRQQRQLVVAPACQRGTKRHQHPLHLLVSPEREVALNVAAWQHATSPTSPSASESCSHPCGVVHMQRSPSAFHIRAYRTLVDRFVVVVVGVFFNDGVFFQDHFNGDGGSCWCLAVSWTCQPPSGAGLPPHHQEPHGFPHHERATAAGRVRADHFRYFYQGFICYILSVRMQNSRSFTEKLYFAVWLNFYDLLLFNYSIFSMTENSWIYLPVNLR